MESGVPYEFRTTVIDQYHEASDFEKMGQWIEGAERYYLQGFTDNDAVPDHSLSAPPAETMGQYREIAARYVKLAEIRGIDT
jgi:pyruvate formate lyase activating enzyme